MQFIFNPESKVVKYAFKVQERECRNLLIRNAKEHINFLNPIAICSACSACSKTGFLTCSRLDNTSGIRVCEFRGVGRGFGTLRAPEYKDTLALEGKRMYKREAMKLS